jgi:sorbitol-specific phosphotransferase system component IIA
LVFKNTIECDRIIIEQEVSGFVGDYSKGNLLLEFTNGVPDSLAEYAVVFCTWF